jgi:tetratricopeptide (TPR) repeat protein
MRVAIPARQTILQPPIDGMRGSAYKDGLSGTNPGRPFLPAFGRLDRTPELHAIGNAMMQEVRSAAAGRKKSAIAAVGSGGLSAAGLAAAYQHYESAVQLVQGGKYEKALAAFEKLLASAPPQLVERCNMYISTCRRQLAQSQLSFLTPEEHYDYAVSQLNTGYYEEAREHFNRILGDHPEADYALYGLALLDSITGRSQDCLRNLARAIELNPKNRLQARADNDFQSMVDDPRFTELLYPEIP